MSKWAIPDANTRGVDRRLFGLLIISTTIGLGHHFDHIIRGNHVGWPIAPEVNPFTYSLFIYPIILVGLYLTYRDWIGARYWVGVGLLSLGILGSVHLGPWAIEPPGDIIDPHDPVIVGYIAFIWVLLLLGVLLVTTIYATRQWRHTRRRVR